MATTNVLGTVYETLLCSPGMNEAIKLDLKLSRKAVLLLNSLIQNGLENDSEGKELLAFIPGEDKEELRAFVDECLKKAGLKELNEKMKGLVSK
ncbi:hypothetical protein FPZ42_06925 [Mucilaginibacter achroorhodeus]|uniref:Uncharacterized protein n=1 Tax=Mucilaginibacter achroorhodeus TaxID=2599294 RepID=A0A563U613_9SPHI|nr:hypothetical protein [Mucilaginibacter achroorhodeus]TWR26763.1 hypothetical protein FPZ42_06925 [Mucilaginibacter achroorhodeus]